MCTISRMVGIEKQHFKVNVSSEKMETGNEHNYSAIKKPLCSPWKKHVDLGSKLLILFQPSFGPRVRKLHDRVAQTLCSRDLTGRQSRPRLLRSLKLLVTKM